MVYNNNDNNDDDDDNDDDDGDDDDNNNNKHNKKSKKNLIRRCSLTRVKLTALYKHLITKATLAYISNKHNLKYCSLPLSPIKQ